MVMDVDPRPGRCRLRNGEVVRRGAQGQRGHAAGEELPPRRARSANRPMARNSASAEKLVRSGCGLLRCRPRSCKSSHCIPDTSLFGSVVDHGS